MVKRNTPKTCKNCGRTYAGPYCRKCHPGRPGRRGLGGSWSGGSGGRGRGRHWNASLSLGHEALPVTPSAAACNQDLGDADKAMFEILSGRGLPIPIVPSAVPFWIVGKWCGEGEQWEFMGFFETESMAVEACKGNPNMFVAPATLNEALPWERDNWPGLYYPAFKGADEYAGN